jgi:hypothetical protein
LNDASDSAENPNPGASAATREAELHPRFERLRAQRSAWGVLAPSGLSDQKQAIAEVGRALSEDLMAFLDAAPSGEDRPSLASLDARLEALECEMRDVAIEVPVAQLRSTLPEQLAVGRRGVLDLLDLILGAETAGQGDVAARIPVLDYLITLLCTGGDPEAPLQDPVNLTPRLHSVCERSDFDLDPRLPELEAEFYSAAARQRGEGRDEVELQTLHRRKVEIGPAFFAPRVLRAIVSYNVALLRRVDEEVPSSQDWRIPATPEAPEAGVSVFETSVLPKLSEALRRRAAGEAPAPDPLDRVAWCLDLAGLLAPEREALLSESTGQRHGLIGTSILVGLLCRAAVVLDEELPAIGISASLLSGAWVDELDAIFQQKANRRIAEHDYDGACVLTGLKSKYLAPAMADRQPDRGRRADSESPVYDPASTRSQAQQVASEALRSASAGEARLRLRDWPWDGIARAGVAGALAVAALAWVNFVYLDATRVPREELQEISVFLSSGKRNEAGTGPDFVGRLIGEWSELGDEEQTTAADGLVGALRDRGVRQVMVYDGDHRLRIQALGDQAARVLR